MKKINGKQILNDSLPTEVIKDIAVDGNATADSSLVPHNKKKLPAWLLGIWRNLKSIFTSITDLNAKYQSIKGYGGYLSPHDFGSDTPSQEELTEYALNQIDHIIDKTEIFNSTHVKNIWVNPNLEINPDQVPDNSVWVLTNTPNTEPPVFEWVNDGKSGISPGSNTMYGSIKGEKDPGDGSKDGYLTFDESGNPKTIGYTDLKEEVSDLGDNKVDKSDSGRLMTITEGEKLSGIASGAQVNVIEGVQRNGTDLSVSGKKVNILTESKPKSGSTKLLESGGVFTEIDGISIPENTDLNNIVAPGHYVIASDTVAATLVNMPFANAAWLEVRRLFNNGYVQILTGYKQIYPKIRIYDGSSWSVWRDILVNRNDVNSSAIVLDDLISREYNQGIRINRSKGIWSGIALGGKKGTTDKIDPAGYSETFTQTEGNGTWWIASDINGDFQITQLATLNPNSLGVALFAKRSGEVYIGKNKYPENVVGARLYGADLGVAPDNVTAIERNEVCYVPGPRTITLERCGNKVILNGYLNVQTQYAGNPSNSSYQTGLKIPNEMLPLGSVKMYLMVNATLDNVNGSAGLVKSRAVSCYLYCPSERVSGNTIPIIIRCEAITPAAYTEMFFDTSWFVE